MDMIFDTATGELTIDTADIHPWGANLRAVLERHGNVISLRGVAMRLSIKADDEKIFNLTLPPPNVKYTQTDQDILATGFCPWSPDQQIVVSAWCRTNNGDELTADASFTAPRPAQPYPSWMWQDGAWRSPVVYPDDGGDYSWNENSQEWVAT